MIRPSERLGANDRPTLAVTVTNRESKGGYQRVINGGWEIGGQGCNEQRSGLSLPLKINTLSPLDATEVTSRRPLKRHLNCKLLY